MSYVDAGYVIALTVLALYSVFLVVRRRRLVRAVSEGRTLVPRAGSDSPPASGPPPAPPERPAGSPTGVAR